MNSEERHAARRARRDARRAEARARRNEAATIEHVASSDALYESARLASRGVRWKASVQRYMAHVLRLDLHARDDLLAGRDIRRGLTRFDVRERGKLRHITSVRFPERVIQKSLTRNALAPAIWPTMTPGCAANIRGRGTDYALMRLKRQLVRHHRLHGTDGYVLLVDFSDYFARIDHAAAKTLVARCVIDPRVASLAGLLVDACGDVGLGLGSEPSQVIAVALPSPIDHLLERLPYVEASGRYMDDTYAIAQDKSDLWEALRLIRLECSRLGITINERKTRVVKLSRGFTFLKRRFSYGKGGSVVVRPSRDSVSRIRRRMRRQARLVADGRMTVEEARQSYLSARGSLERSRGDGRPRLRMASHRTVRSMDALFRELFGESATT